MATSPLAANGISTKTTANRRPAPTPTAGHSRQLRHSTTSTTRCSSRFLLRAGVRHPTGCGPRRARMHCNGSITSSRRCFHHLGHTKTRCWPITGTWPTRFFRHISTMDCCYRPKCATQQRRPTKKALCPSIRLRALFAKSLAGANLYGTPIGNTCPSTAPKMHLAQRATYLHCLPTQAKQRCAACKNRYTQFMKIATHITFSG